MFFLKKKKFNHQMDRKLFYNPLSVTLMLKLETISHREEKEDTVSSYSDHVQPTDVVWPVSSTPK